MNTWTFMLPTGIDFDVWVRAGRLLLAGNTPFLAEGYYNPVWGALLLCPFSLLPERIAWPLFFCCAFMGYWVVFMRLTGKLASAALLMLSPFTLLGIMSGNIDWLVLLGVLLRPALGVWLLLLKPQLSLGVLLLYFLRGLRDGTWYKLLPAVLAVIASAALGLYPQVNISCLTWNAAIFPWGLLPGLIVFFIALWRDDARLALAVGPLCAPYLTAHTWIGVQVGFSPLGIALFSALGTFLALRGAGVITW